MSGNCAAPRAALPNFHVPHPNLGDIYLRRSGTSQMRVLTKAFECGAKAIVYGALTLPWITAVEALDRVRPETRVDEAVSRYGVSGKGVIFAMLDRGIDWQNNDFRNNDGTTRIAYI